MGISRLRPRATQLPAVLLAILHRQEWKCPRKPIQDPYTNYFTLSQEQSISSTMALWTKQRQTSLPVGGPETINVIDNVLGKISRPTHPLNFWFLGAKSTSIRDCVRRSVGPLVGPSPAMQLHGKLVTSRLLREEEEEEETDYITIPLRRNSFAPRD
jgi:hypothetical protein